MGGCWEIQAHKLIISVYIFLTVISTDRNAGGGTCWIMKTREDQNVEETVWGTKQHCSLKTCWCDATYFPLRPNPFPLLAGDTFPIETSTPSWVTFQPALSISWMDTWPVLQGQQCTDNIGVAGPPFRQWYCACELELSVKQQKRALEEMGYCLNHSPIKYNTRESWWLAEVLALGRSSVDSVSVSAEPRIQRHCLEEISDLPEKICLHKAVPVCRLKGIPGKVCTNIQSAISNDRIQEQ